MCRHSQTAPTCLAMHVLHHTGTPPLLVMQSVTHVSQFTSGKWPILSTQRGRLDRSHWAVTFFRLHSIKWLEYKFSNNPLGSNAPQRTKILIIVSKFRKNPATSYLLGMETNSVSGGLSGRNRSFSLCTLRSNIDISETQSPSVLKYFKWKKMIAFSFTLVRVWMVKGLTIQWKWSG